MLLVLGAAWGAWVAAERFQGRDDDLRAGIREALTEAWGRNRGRAIDLSDVVEDDWDQLYVFRPLTPRDRIDSAIAPADLDDDRDLVPPDKSFVVQIGRA